MLLLWVDAACHPALLRVAAIKCYHRLEVAHAAGHVEGPIPAALFHVVWAGTECAASADGRHVSRRVERRFQTCGIQVVMSRTFMICSMYV